MCGRYLVITEEEIIEMRSILEELDQRFSDEGAFSIRWLAASAGEAVPGAVAPVLVADGEGCRLRPMKWGFSRRNASGAVINARSESIEEKPFFRESLLHRRCVVPSRGFFEWKKPSPAPLLDLAAAFSDPFAPGKYWIRRDDSPLFFMAGIYRQGCDFEEFVILTMPASQQIAPLHDRMPVFLEKVQLVPWLQNPGMLRILTENRASSAHFLLSRAAAPGGKSL